MIGWKDGGSLVRGSGKEVFGGCFRRFGRLVLIMNCVHYFGGVYLGGRDI